MEGKARRNLVSDHTYFVLKIFYSLKLGFFLKKLWCYLAKISIDDEQSRRKKFESEAQRLADMLKDEGEIFIY